MRQYWKRRWSIFLTILLVVQLFAMYGYAEETDMPPEASAPVEERDNGETESTSMRPDYATVEGEVEDLREESVKHFRLEDGTFVAVDYGMPVHYENPDGTWEDIDNTLLPKEQAYRAMNGTLEKSFAASMENGVLAEVAYAGHTVKLALVEDVRTYEERIAAEDPAVREAKANVLAEAAAKAVEEISADASVEGTNSGVSEQEPMDDSAIQEAGKAPSDQDGIVSDNLEATPAVQAAKAAIPTEQAADGTLYRLVRSDQVAAEVQNPTEEDMATAVSEDSAGESADETNGEDSSMVSGEALAKQIALTKQVSSVRYGEPLKDTDILYENYGYNLKESLVVRAPQTSYRYAFHLDLSDLTPVMQEDGSIALLDEAKEEIFTIPAPYMEDTDGVQSTAASYTLTPSTSGYVLTVTADPSWMNAAERVFPVTIDPTLLLHNNGGVKTTMIRDRAKTSKAPDYADQYCGWDDETGYGDCQVVFQAESMPAIPVNCSLVNATVMMAHAGFFTKDFSSASSGYLTVEAHRLNQPSSNVLNLTWNGVYGTGGLGVNEIVLDYQKLSASTRNKYVSWDITAAVLDWFNTGAAKGAILLKSTDAKTQQRFANLIGHAWKDNSPYFAVQYRQNVGLEEYYTYQEEDADGAGTLSISDFTQRLNLEHEDVSLSLAAQEVTLSHFYNSGESNQNFTANAAMGLNTANYSTMKLGQGWKLSAQQTVVEKTIGKDPYLIYTDGDGTEHYFAKDGSSYRDEDGLGLTITKQTVSGNTVYSMKDTDAYHTWTFHNGYLISVLDHNGNEVLIAYNQPYQASQNNWKPVANQANRIVQIVEHTDAGGNSQNIVAAALTYNASNYLMSITDYAGRTTGFTYAGDRLIQITHPDGTKAQYQYQSAGELQTLYDSESKYGLALTWQKSFSAGQGYQNRVKQVTEFTAPTIDGTRTTGNRYHMYRNSSQLMSCRYYGEDHAVDTADDLVVFNAFDYYGRTIDSYTTDTDKVQLLGVSAGAYRPNDKSHPEANNRLSRTASSGQHVENLLLDSGLEYDLAGSGWGKEVSSTDDSQANAAVGGRFQFGSRYTGYVEPHSGNKQLKTYLGTNVPIGTGHAYMKQKVTLTAGKSYTFSAYVNTATLVDLSAQDMTHGSSLAVLNVAGAVKARSDIMHYYTNPALENGWERLSVTYTPSATADYWLAVCQDGVRGITAFDDVQLECGDTMSGVNLLQDAGFDKTTGNTYWSARTTVNAAAGDMPPAQGKILKLTGAYASNRRVSQTVAVNQPSDSTFLLSGWGKAHSVFFAARDDGTTYDRFFGLIALVTYADNTTETHYVPFSPMYADWQYASGVVAPKKSGTTVKSIQVSCAYDRNANDAYFEKISLIREPADTYTYDSKGNPVAVTTEKTKTACEYFSGTSKLKSYTTPGGTKHTLTYQSGTNNVATETLNSVTTSMSYASSGVETSEMTRKGSSGSYLKTTSGYDAPQHHQTTQTDVNGITRTDTYHASTHLLTGSQTGTRPTQTYAYNAANERLDGTWMNGLAASSYGYTNGMPDMFIRKSFTSVGGSTEFWQRYTMAYDNFGNNTAVSVSSSADGTAYSALKKLASYVYSANNGRMTGMTFANGNTVNYVYDRFDRMTEESYSNGVQYHYRYDAEGNLTEQFANSNQSRTEGYTYAYDSLGRLIHSKETDGGGQMVQRTEHLYDTSDRLTAQNWMLRANNVTGSQQYTYSTADETLSTLSNQVKVGTGSSDTQTTVLMDTVQYGYNTLRQLTRKTTGNRFYRAYSYRSGRSAEQTTAQIDYMNYRKPNDDLIRGYRYTYDGNGNIAAVYESLAAGGSASTPLQSYTYDNLGQLSQTVDSKTHETYKYTYDTAGNLKTLKTLATAGGTLKKSKTLTYGDSVWKDRLTKVQVGNTSENITYETPSSGYISGNPIRYFNGKHYDFTWQQGRQLATAKVDEKTSTYTYDMAGVRSSKTVNGTTYKFDTLSGLVTHQSGNNRELYFVYDDSNQPYALIQKNGSGSPVLYYYLLNQQGDVVGLMNSSGTIQATYHYDPWGAVTVYTASGTVDTGTTSIGAVNPLRYRGYYYDTETGLYYLQSRYYDPAIGRFINADSYACTNTTNFLSYNMFAYCENDPVNREDREGEVYGLAVAGIAVLSPATLLVGIGIATVVTIGVLYAHSKKTTGRVHRKKRGREILEKKKNSDRRKTKKWKKRSGKREGRPEKHHEPGREHKKYGKKK